MRHNIKAISIMEFVILVVIIGILSGLTLNNFFRAVQQNFEREAIAQIKVIQEHLEKIKEITGQYPYYTLPNRLSINNHFDLQIPNNDYLSYQYIPSSNAYIVDVLTARGWGIRYNSLYPNRGLHCINGPCPNCQEDGENCGN